MPVGLANLDDCVGRGGAFAAGLRSSERLLDAMRDSGVEDLTFASNNEAG